MKIKLFFRVLFFLLVFFLFCCLVYVSKQSLVLQHFNEQKKVNILAILDGNNALPNTFALVSYNSTNKNLSIFYMPSNVYVELVGKKKQINQMFSYYKKQDGISKLSNNMKACFSEILGVDIPFYLYVDLNGIKKLSENNDFTNKYEFLKSVQKKYSFDNVWYMQQEYFLVSFLRNVLRPDNILNVKTNLQIMNTNLNLVDGLRFLVEVKDLSQANILRYYMPFNKRNRFFDREKFKEIFAGVRKKNNKIVVEVLNASIKKGEALRVTRFLRDNGIDVVKWDNYYRKQPYTIVIDRKGNLSKVVKIAKLLKCDNVFTELDDSRYVDVSIVLGMSHEEKSKTK